MKKIEVFVKEINIDTEMKILLEGQNLIPTTSTNANQPVGLIIRDGQEVIAEFTIWTYWKKLE